MNRFPGKKQSGKNDTSEAEKLLMFPDFHIMLANLEVLSSLLSRRVAETAQARNDTAN